VRPTTDPGGTMLIHDPFSSVGVTLAIAATLRLSGRQLSPVAPSSTVGGPETAGVAVPAKVRRTEQIASQPCPWEQLCSEVQAWLRFSAVRPLRGLPMVMSMPCGGRLRRRRVGCARRVPAAIPWSGCGSR